MRREFVAFGTSRLFATVTLLLAGAAAHAQPSTASPAGLPVLTSARKAHDMTAEESSRGYPVHLRAVATYYDPDIDSRRGVLFVCDATGCVFVAVPARPVLPIRAGSEIDIEGVSGPGDFAPIVTRAAVRVTGAYLGLPEARRVAFSELHGGASDCAWVEVEGLVRRVRELGKNVTLDIDAGGSLVSATTVREPGADYGRLLDAQVRVRGNAAPLYLGNRVTVGGRVFFQTLAQVAIVEAGPADPFTLATVPAADVLKFSPGLKFLHRVHVRGHVTLYWPGRTLCIEDRNHGLCVQAAQSSKLETGDVVDVVGFPSNGDSTALYDAAFRRAGGGKPPEPRITTSAQALGGELDNGLLQMEGRLIGQSRSGDDQALVLSSENSVFLAVLPPDFPHDEIPWKPGSILRVTGICSLQFEAPEQTAGTGGEPAKSFRILLRSARDVAIVKQVPWWTPARALIALGLVALVALSVFAWVLMLRRRVGEQTSAIAHEKERYRSLVDHAPDIVFATDLSGNLTSANPAAKLLLGYTERELIGRNMWDLLPGTEREAAREHMRHLIAGESPAPLECDFQVKGGGLLAVEVNLSILRKDGRPAAVHGILRDSSERRRLEEQLRQAQKMEAIGRLAGGVAHDFNNLLTVINGYSDMLLKDLPEDDPERPALMEIRDAGEHAVSLTKQLLTFGRRQISRPRALDLNALIAAAESMLLRLIGEDIVLETSLDPALEAVEADPGQMHQVLLNLSINARDAMPDGGTLVIATAAARFDQDSAPPGCQPGAYARLTVADTGAGMDEETMRHLFEPFFTTKPSGLGTGLGLATVYGVVQQSRGSIRVHSSPGEGCRFEIHLPCAAGPAEPVAPLTLDPPQPQRELTVLVAEDQDSVRRLASHALRACGYHVLEAAGGAEALHLAEAVRGGCQLVVTDVVMPGMSGKELAEALRARWPEIRVLFMSGYPNEVILRHGLMNAEVNYLEKPFTPSELAAKVREVME